MTEITIYYANRSIFVAYYLAHYFPYKRNTQKFTLHNLFTIKIIDALKSTNQLLLVAEIASLD